MIGPETTVREFATAETLELLAAAAKAIRKASGDPHEDAVHKMRVSIRRFQQSLRLFGQFLRPKGLRRVKADLKAIMTPAGELRNCDIARKLAGARSSAAKLLAARRQQAEATLIATLTQLSSGNLAERWTSDLGSARGAKKRKGRLWRGKRTVQSNLRRRMPGLVADYFEAGNTSLQPGRSWEEMHHFRLLTKRFRYTLELLRPAYGRALESRIDLLRQVQTLLGDINDAVVTSGMLAEIPNTERVRTRLAVRADRMTHELRALWTARFANPSHVQSWTRYLVQYACRALRPAAPGSAPDSPATPPAEQSSPESVTDSGNVTSDSPKSTKGSVY